MSSQPTDPGDQPLTEEGFYQVKAKQQPQQNLAPTSGQGTGGPAGQGIRLGGPPTPPDQPQGDVVLPDKGRFSGFLQPNEFGEVPWPYHPDQPAVAPKNKDRIEQPPDSLVPNTIRPQPEWEGKYGGKFNASASDNSGNNGDTSDQPLTEDGFKQLLAKSTNVPRTGGPDPSQLQVSIGESAPGSKEGFTAVDPTKLATREEYDSEGKSSQYGPNVTKENPQGNRLVTGPYIGLHPNDMNRFGLKWGDYVQTSDGEVLRVQESASKEHTIEFHADRPGQFQDANPSLTIVGVRHATSDDPPMPSGESVNNTGPLGTGSGTESSPHIPTQEEQTEEAKKRDAAQAQAKQQQQKPKPKQGEQPKEEEKVPENQPVTQQEDEVGYPAWSVRGGMMSPQQQAQLEAVQRRPATQAGQVTSENPILANILAKIYEQYGG